MKMKESGVDLERRKVEIRGIKLDKEIELRKGELELREREIEFKEKNQEWKVRAQEQFV